MALPSFQFLFGSLSALPKPAQPPSDSVNALPLDPIPESASIPRPSTPNQASFHHAGPGFPYPIPVPPSHPFSSHTLPLMHYSPCVLPRQIPNSLYPAREVFLHGHHRRTISSDTALALAAALFRTSSSRTKIDSKSTRQTRGETRTCANCGTTETPLWRRDADGKPTCNSCGLYFKLHKTRRPEAMFGATVKRRNRTPPTDGKVTTPTIEMKMLIEEVKVEPESNEATMTTTNATTPQSFSLDAQSPCAPFLEVAATKKELSTNENGISALLLLAKASHYFS